ncbi:MAG TPA: hypothetical protein VF039_08975 [Longimicrobiales bacterium]
MRDSNGGTNDRGNMERVGESVGAMAGRAADWGMEMSGAMFRSAAQMLGGWWSTDAPSQVASSWSDRAEQNCRSHFQSGGSVGGTSSGATQATHAAPKSPHAAMQSAGEIQTDTGRSSSGSGTGGGGAHVGGSAQVGDTKLTGSANFQASSPNTERTTSPESATDGFARARPGYQLGYVARQNPAYRGRSFNEIEPELRQVWESRARTEGSAGDSGSSWPEVRGFVDFAYQQGE